MQKLNELRALEAQVTEKIFWIMIIEQQWSCVSCVTYTQEHRLGMENVGGVADKSIFHNVTVGIRHARILSFVAVVGGPRDATQPSFHEEETSLMSCPTVSSEVTLMGNMFSELVQYFFF